MKTTKTIPTHEGELEFNARTTLRHTCATCCQKVLAQINSVREVILAESKQARTVSERLLRLVLNEAEALAWQTTYPHLVFPILAKEKVQSLEAWNANQQSVHRSSPLCAGRLKRWKTSTQQ